MRLAFACSAELVAEPRPAPATLPIAAGPPTALDSFEVELPGGDTIVRVTRYPAEARRWVEDNHPGKVRPGWDGGAVVFQVFMRTR